MYLAHISDDKLREQTIREHLELSLIHIYRLEFFTPRRQLCQLFIGHIFTWPVFQQKFKISINIQSVCFGHLNHCVNDCTGIRTIYGTAKQPVLTANCEWADRILTEIVSKTAASVLQIGLGCICLLYTSRCV